MICMIYYISQTVRRGRYGIVKLLFIDVNFIFKIKEFVIMSPDVFLVEKIFIFLIFHKNSNKRIDILSI